MLFQHNIIPKLVVDLNPGSSDESGFHPAQNKQKSRYLVEKKRNELNFLRDKFVFTKDREV
jgi:hypothetical protein